MYIRPLDRDDHARRARQRRARQWRRRPIVWLSLALHVLLLAAVFILPPPLPPPQDEQPSPSFEIVMDGGASTPTSNGKQNPNAAPALTEGKPNPSPPPSPAPAPSAPQPPSPAPQQEASIEPPPQPSPPQPAPQPPQPAPTQPAPPRVDLSSLPSLPPPVPLPQPPPPLPLPPIPPPPRPRLLARPTPPRSSSGFPAPQNWALNGRGPSQAAPEGALGHANTAGPGQPAPLITGAELGRDWISAYKAWVQARLYYPEQAAENGEDGSAEVVLKINRFGRVESVQLVGRSGSMWLDLAIQALFRGRNVPPFPPDTKEDEATIDQTIQYILRRR